MTGEAAGRVWLALDGVGHPADAPTGSVWDQALPALRPLVDTGAALDPTLGVPGLPQSGTGQTCWLTGQDAVRVMGEHFGPQPGPTLQRLLRAGSLPARLAAQGARAALANHYPPAYFQAQARREQMGCFPFAFRAAGFPLNPPGVPLVSPTLGLTYARPWTETAALHEVTLQGKELGRAARRYDLVVLDLWFSDLLGHQGQAPTPPEVLAAGRAYLRRVDALLAGLLDTGAQVALSSDHGNLEDLSVKSHTRARVPLTCSGGLDLGGVTDIVQGGQTLARWAGLSR